MTGWSHLFFSTMIFHRWENATSLAKKKGSRLWKNSGLPRCEQRKAHCAASLLTRESVSDYWMTSNVVFGRTAISWSMLLIFLDVLQYLNLKLLCKSPCLFSHVKLIAYGYICCFPSLKVADWLKSTSGRI